MTQPQPDVTAPLRAQFLPFALPDIVEEEIDDLAVSALESSDAGFDAGDGFAVDRHGQPVAVVEIDPE